MTTFSPTVTIGKNSTNPLAANKPGYGTMRLTGSQIWGEPADRANALQILRRAVELGVNYFDTADYYGPGVTNRLLVEALHPYNADIIIGTKIGAERKPDKSWVPFSKPEELRQSVENNLKELKQEQLSLVHFRVMSNSIASFDESMDAMFALQKEGLILHVGVSNVAKEQLQTAMTKGAVASVQNLYSYAQRTTLAGHYGGEGGEQVLPLCEEAGIAFIPYFSLQTSLSKKTEKIESLATKMGVSAAQLNIAWLLHKSDCILPIPGTTSLEHLEENMAAAEIALSKEEMNYLG